MQLSGHSSVIGALAVLLNGDLAIASSIITIWSFDFGGIKYLPISALAAFNNGDLASSSTTSIKIWNTTDGSVRKTLEGHRANVISLAILPNGDLVSESWDNTVR